MSLKNLNQQIIACKKCPRLVGWCQQVAREKRASYQNWDYWGKPVPSFGDPKAQVLIVGLAPAAHGGNRTGRLFTGDRSGEWLFRALYRAGLANQSTWESAEDGLKLINTYISDIVHCAPPDNKPLPEERDACLEYFVQEIPQLIRLKVVIVLGQFSFDGFLRFLAKRGQKPQKKLKFGHGLEYQLAGYHIICSFHPSQRNTFTGKLTEKMFDGIFMRARELIDA